MNDRVFLVESDRQKAHLLAYLSKQALPFQTLVGPIREQRSLSANNRLWALHEVASDYTGYSKEEMHEHALCHHFGFTEREVKDLFTGEITMKRIPLKRSSTRNKQEFRLFMDATETWYGSEFGVWLPDVPR